MLKKTAGGLNACSEVYSMNTIHPKSIFAKCTRLVCLLHSKLCEFIFLGDVFPKYLTYLPDQPS